MIDMTQRHLGQPRLAILTLLLAAALLAGCQQRDRGVNVTVVTPGAPDTTFRSPFDDCAYVRNADHDYHVLAHSMTVSRVTGGLSELIQANIYWRPRPGRTGDHPTSADAIIRYIVVADDGLAIYRGTAYVYPKLNKHTGTLTVLIERATLELEDEFGHSPAGATTIRLSGRLHAADDPGRAVELRRRVELARGGNIPRGMP